MKTTSAFWFFLLLLLHFFSCKPKDEILSTSANDRLSFSEDTIFFDTLFTTVGSITKRLIVHNSSKNRIRVSSISLAGGSNSPYSIIVNGRSGPSLSDIDILGNDSIYVLIKVLMDPSNQNLPFLVSDSILFNTNSNKQKVQLETYGQDAHFYVKETVPCNTLWTNDKPYVIYDTININAGCELKIEAGCKIYLHNAAAINVKGKLTIEGTSLDSVLIASDKLDASAKDDLGQWGGIIFQSTSSGNSISWTTIRNASTAITLMPVVDTDTIPELTLDHVYLLHTSKGMINAAETDLNASNVVMSHCPMALLKHTAGYGVWKHCTFANYSSGFFREEPNMLLGSTVQILKMYVFNSIVWGDKIDEVSSYNSTQLFLQSSIWRSTFTGTSSNILNSNPLFKSPSQFNFSLTATSPAINLCVPEGVPDDIVGAPRDATPDAGAYEFQ
ncbi:choice-of-anchor Q domain-containing protein [Cytophaga aurantiaca]|uniref:choice-of-anchor Q domain-containing protein n=1 Tax=Cytophaga aurantiaca TaxID=29530 RepID=UPI0003638B89|nr:choice-of-anchor Q domain-containing protein [Cytophaga aurantiaca]